MAEKNKGAIDPVAIRELISQGIPMKKKESEMIPPSAVEETDEAVSATPKEALEELQLPIRTRRKNTAKGNYISLFMHRNDLYDRKAIYISKELQDKLSEIVLFIRKRDDIGYVRGKHPSQTFRGLQGRNQSIK